MAEVRKNDTLELKAIRAKHDLKAGTPTGLGVLLVAIVSLLFLLLFPLISRIDLGQNLLSGHDLRFEVLAILVTFTGFGLLGLYDDILKIFGFAKSGFFGLRRWHKFAIQWGLLWSVPVFYFWFENSLCKFAIHWDLGFGIWVFVCRVIYNCCFCQCF